MLRRNITALQGLLKTDSRVTYFLCASFCVLAIGFFSFLFSYISTTDTIHAQDVQTKTTQTNKASILELHIAANGLVFLQGTKVISISGNNIVVVTSWNNLNFTWLVQTNESYYGKHHFGTSFYDASGKVIALADLQPGDIITVSGMMQTNYTEPVVKADVIRTSN